MKGVNNLIIEQFPRPANQAASETVAAGGDGQTTYHGYEQETRSPSIQIRAGG